MTDKTRSSLWDTKLNRRQVLKTGAAGGVAVLAAGCVPGAASTGQMGEAPAVVSKKTTLTMGIGGDVPGMNVLERAVAPATSVYYAMWDTGMEAEFNPDGSRMGIKPMLITDWKVLDDQTTWEFKLREGITFNNGEPWDAEAAAWNIDYRLTGETSRTSFRSLLISKYEGVEVVDKHTLRLKTNIPFAFTPLIMMYLQVAPPAYYQDVGLEGYGENPVGLGPYRFVEWRKGQHIVLERNPDYWGEQATVDELIFKPFTEDATRVAALQADEIDMAYNVPPDDAQRLTDAGLEISYIAIGQAMNLTMKTGSNPGHPLESPINDKLVRQAMNYALDKDSLVNDIMGGFAAPLDGQIVGPSCFGYNPSLEAYPHDPDKAMELLAEAGYPDGFTMDFDSAQGRYSKQKEVSEWMVGEFSKVGINLEMQLFEWSAFIDKVYSDQSAPVFYTGRNWYPTMDPENTLKMYECSERRAQVCEDELETMLFAQRAEFDQAKRETMLHDIHAWLYDYCPVVYLFEAPDIFGHSARVKNFTPTPDNRVHLIGMTVEES